MRSGENRTSKKNKTTHPLLLVFEPVTSVSNVVGLATLATEVVITRYGPALDPTARWKRASASVQFVSSFGCSPQAPPAEVLDRRRVHAPVREALGLPRLLVRVYRRCRVPGGLQQEVPALEDRYTVAILGLAHTHSVKSRSSVAYSRPDYVSSTMVSAMAVVENWGAKKERD